MNGILHEKIVGKVSLLNPVVSVITFKAPLNGKYNISHCILDSRHLDLRFEKAGSEEESRGSDKDVDLQAAPVSVLPNQLFHQTIKVCGLLNQSLCSKNVTRTLTSIYFYDLYKDVMNQNEFYCL